MPTTDELPITNESRDEHGSPAGRPRRRAHVRRIWITVAVLAAVTTASLLGGVAPPVSAQPGATTSTLPVDSRQLGNSLTRPNQGMSPQDAGDPGGWLQVSLFFLICGAVLIIATAVWWQSRRARRRRDEAGYDPIALAKASGRGVRAPSGDAS